MRTMEQDDRVTELLRTYDQTVAALVELGVDAVLARGGSIEWRVKEEHPPSPAIYDDMRDEAQARSWIAVNQAEYPPIKYTIERRHVLRWEPVELGEEA